MTTVTLSGNVSSGAGMGYYFPNGSALNVLRETRTGSGATSHFATLWIPHGTNPSGANYSYVLLPGKTAEETAAYAENADVEIIEVTDSVHAVRETTLGITAINFWSTETYSCAGINVNAPCSVMVMETSEGWKMSMH